MGVADVFDRTKDASVGGLVDAGTLILGRRKVIFLKAADLSVGWASAIDTRRTNWKIVRHAQDCMIDVCFSAEA